MTDIAQGNALSAICRSFVSDCAERATSRAVTDLAVGDVCRAGGRTSRSFGSKEIKASEAGSRGVADLAIRDRANILSAGKIAGESISRNAGCALAGGVGAFTTLGIIAGYHLLAS